MPTIWLDLYIYQWILLTHAMGVHVKLSKIDAILATPDLQGFMTSINIVPGSPEF